MNKQVEPLDYKEENSQDLIDAEFLVENIEEEPEKEEIEGRPSRWDRYFSAINEGSFRSALISACIFSLGPIVISIPFKFSKVGLVYGWLILLTCASVNFITMYILIKLSSIYKKHTYTALIRRICGKFWAKVFDIFMMLTYSGTFTLYIVISKIC